MLVLSRHKDERIFINGGEIIITVIDLRDGKVRLGFEADRSVVIHREEIQTKADEHKRLEDQS
jgi:carbon storage regulator